jgi:hypothetical protein
LIQAEDIDLFDGRVDCSDYTPEDFLQYITPYYKIIKTCTQSDNNNCGYPDGHTWLSPDGSYKNMGMYDFAIDSSRAGITLADGTFILFRFRDSDSVACLVHRTLVDLNGPKGPNILGKDVFWFYWDGTPVSEGARTRGCYKGGWGMNCAYKIMEDGWEIKEDYPY